MKRRALWTGGALALLALTLLRVILAGGERVPVEAGPIDRRIVARAVVEAVGGVARVGDFAPGTVEDVRVRVGDSVTEHQLLADFERADSETVELRAPRRGTIVGVHVTKGDNVAPGAPMFELADVTDLEVRIEVDQTSAAAIAPGQGVTLRALGGGEPLGTGKLSRVSRVVEAHRIGAGERAGGPVVSAWMTLEAGHSFVLGMELEAVIALGPVEVAARVPHAAVAIEEGRSVVCLPGWLMARRIPVTLGLSDEHHVEIHAAEPPREVLLPE